MRLQKCYCKSIVLVRCDWLKSSFLGPPWRVDFSVPKLDLGLWASMPSICPSGAPIFFVMEPEHHVARMQ
jgi:hypothetical protein